MVGRRKKTNGTRVRRKNKIIRLSRMQPFDLHVIEDNMKKDKIQEIYESMLTERKVTTNDVKMLRRKLDEVEAVIKAGESPFELLGYLKTEIGKLMKNIM